MRKLRLIARISERGTNRRLFVPELEASFRIHDQKDAERILSALNIQPQYYSINNNESSEKLSVFYFVEEK